MGVFTDCLYTAIYTRRSFGNFFGTILGKTSPNSNQMNIRVHTRADIPVRHVHDILGKIIKSRIQNRSRLDI